MNNTKSLQMGRPAGAREAAHRRPYRHLQRRALPARHQRRGKARPHEVVQHIAVEVYRRLECALFSTSSEQHCTVLYMRTFFVTGITILYPYIGNKVA